MSYHLTEIAKGVLGELSKIQEELDEVKDAEQQNNKIMIGCELSDLYGALEAYANKFGLSMNDLSIMSEATKRAFDSGRRKDTKTNMSEVIEFKTIDDTKKDNIIYKCENVLTKIYFSDLFDGYYVEFKEDAYLDFEGKIVNCSGRVITIKTNDSGCFHIEKGETFDEEIYTVVGKSYDLIKVESHKFDKINMKYEKAKYPEYIRIKELIIENNDVKIQEYDNYRIIESEHTDVRIIETKQCSNNTIQIKGDFVKNISNIELQFRIEGMHISLKPNKHYRCYQGDVSLIEFIQTNDHSYQVSFRGELSENLCNSKTKSDYKEYKQILASTRL